MTQNKAMHAIGTVLVYFFIEMALIIIDFALYYSENGATRAPLVIGAALALMVFVLMLMALYESIKHRHDKEPW